jgi:hypothetical protein
MRVDKAGVLDSLIAASTRGVSVRIICPITDRNLGIVKRIAENAPLLQVHNGRGLPYGFIIADNEKYFSAAGGMEEPEAENISEAIGFGLYSNSRASIDSFRSFFELIWNKPYEESSLTENEVKIYLEQVINEVSRAGIAHASTRNFQKI